MQDPAIATVILQYPSRYHDCSLDLIRNRHPELVMRQTHVIDLPVLCAYSKNPGQGSTLKISYTAGETLLELFALEKYIHAFINHPEVRDMEYLVQVIALETSKALDAQVEVELDAHLVGLQQRQQVRVQAG